MTWDEAALQQVRSRGLAPGQPDESRGLPEQVEGAATMGGEYQLSYELQPHTRDKEKGTRLYCNACVTL